MTDRDDDDDDDAVVEALRILDPHLPPSSSFSTSHRGGNGGADAHPSCARASSPPPPRLTPRRAADAYDLLVNRLRSLDGYDGYDDEGYGGEKDDTLPKRFLLPPSFDDDDDDEDEGGQRERGGGGGGGADGKETEDEEQLRSFVRRRADLYRCLLVSCVVLLELLTPFRACPSRDEDDGKEEDERRRRRRSELRRTARRSILLLRSLSLRVGPPWEEEEGEKGTARGDDNGEGYDWHDDGPLPPPRIGLLRDSFVLRRDCNGDRRRKKGGVRRGRKRSRIVSLDPRDYVDDTDDECNLGDEVTHGDEDKERDEGDDGADDGERSDGERSDGDGDDVIGLDCIDAEALAEEEEMLIDVALPSTKRGGRPNKRRRGGRRCGGGAAVDEGRSTTKRHRVIGGGDGDGNDKKTEANPAFSVAKVPPLPVRGGRRREGWLVLASTGGNGDVDDDGRNGRDGAAEGKTAGGSVRCRALLDARAPGLLILVVPSSPSSPRGRKRRCTDYYYYLRPGSSSCEPTVWGDGLTFHFQLDGILPLSTPFHDPNGHFNKGGTLADAAAASLVFGVDISTGGGLAEGCRWVGSISDAVAVAKRMMDHQERLREEFGVEKWESCADYLLQAWHVELSKRNEKEGFVRSYLLGQK